MAGSGVRALISRENRCCRIKWVSFLSTKQRLTIAYIMRSDVLLYPVWILWASNSFLLASIQRCSSDEDRMHHNVTSLLDYLLGGYDQNLRPDFEGPPTLVEIDFNVRSMGPLSEIEMTFSMDCYFRQTWIDRRLSFAGDIPTVTLGISTLERIWKPDTYFLNGKRSHLHIITVPNKFVRIDNDGRVLYSQRLTVKASCPMSLENFPMDTQKCPLKLGSFGYPMRDVLYYWNSKRRVVIAKDMRMSQFDVVATQTGNGTWKMRLDEFSILSVNFLLRRHTGYFLIQVYAPCVLLVVLSWVAFWINREATADRVALGVTTILTMTFLGLDSRSDLPKVSYSTALDTFIALSFAFVFATIIQFALVHYFTKRGSGETFPTASSEDMVSSCNDSSSEDGDGDGQMGDNDEHDHPKKSQYKPSNDQQSLSHNCFQWAAWLTMVSERKTRNAKSLAERSDGEVECNSVSKLDSISRVLFPFSFFVINLCYWCIYLSRDASL